MDESKNVRGPAVFSLPAIIVISILATLGAAAVSLCIYFAYVTGDAIEKMEETEEEVFYAYFAFWWPSEDAAEGEVAIAQARVSRKISLEIIFYLEENSRYEAFRKQAASGSEVAEVTIEVAYEDARRAYLHLQRMIEKAEQKGVPDLPTMPKEPMIPYNSQSYRAPLPGSALYLIYFVCI